MRFGVHDVYPLGGMAEREEWLPRGPDDWRRDLRAPQQTIGAYAGAFLSTGVRVTGVPREACPLVETRVPESDAGALELGLAVDGYEGEQAVVAGHAVAYVRLRRRTS